MMQQYRLQLHKKNVRKIRGSALPQLGREWDKRGDRGGFFFPFSFFLFFPFTLLLCVQDIEMYLFDKTIAWIYCPNCFWILRRPIGEIDLKK